ncbi:hypothetical protein G9C85_05110 [Halorubellus sp. JP-L1]|uniref:hypothetical protein n=1 Tax=Halorubellus sp. JP-L1 TaxID=2715753 RepID=UPI00140DCF41|nr:hypothetical protein [Halorubellus sp. JP-L1]NHN41015.1 hypothetical protein [Halorubellus sp. JP-L1]
MSATSDALTEPRVLAHAKRRLFPEVEGREGYAVTDTQFATEEWMAGERVDEGVREVLAPFNHVRVGSGYPDVVGVGSLDDDLLGVTRHGEEPPLVVVEAKGFSASGRVDVGRGVVQAHDRLGEANVAFVAAPSVAVSESARSLARELNVGVLGVDADGGVVTLEHPRVVGTRTTTETTAIRFQASAQGVAERSFGLNHPKNYLGYALAVAHDRSTADVVGERVVGAAEDAARGAAFLGLVDDAPAGRSVTPLGREVVRFALDEYGSVDAALDAFADWKGSQRRFCELAPRWGLLARRVLWAYPATQLLVEELQSMHDDGIASPSLVDVVEYLHALHPSFAIELFVRGTEGARERVLDRDGDLKVASLADGSVYHSPTVFQLKAMLYHAGFLTERGAEPSNLDPTADVWRLRNPVGDRRDPAGSFVE